MEHATATGVLDLIKKAFKQHGVDSLKEHTVGFGADGAAVNLGIRGVSVLMKSDEGIDWLVTVHCASHRLELSIADALKSTVFSDINEMLQNVYSFYKKSPKKMIQLEGLGEALEMAVCMPVKSSGTRWLEHKIRAMSWISKNYGLLIAHLNHLTEMNRSQVQTGKNLRECILNTEMPSTLCLWSTSLKYSCQQQN